MKSLLGPNYIQGCVWGTAGPGGNLTWAVSSSPGPAGDGLRLIESGEECNQPTHTHWAQHHSLTLLVAFSREQKEMNVLDSLAWSKWRACWQKDKAKVYTQVENPFLGWLSRGVLVSVYVFNTDRVSVFHWIFSLPFNDDCTAAKLLGESAHDLGNNTVTFTQWICLQGTTCQHKQLQLKMMASSKKKLDYAFIKSSIDAA